MTDLTTLLDPVYVKLPIKWYVLVNINFYKLVSMVPNDVSDDDGFFWGGFSLVVLLNKKKKQKKTTTLKTVWHDNTFIK